MEGLSIKNIAVTPEAAKDLLTTALNAGATYGFGYWGTPSGIRRDAEGRVTSMTVTELEAYGYGSDTPRKKLVSYRHVREALLLILHDGGKSCECQGFVKQILTDDIDGPTAEIVVQVICFGKVLYG